MRKGIGKIIVGSIVFLIVPIIGLFIGPVFIIWGIINLSNDQSHTTPKMAQEFGEGYKYSHAYEGTAIAVDPNTQTLKVRSVFPNQGAIEKIYPFSSIRRVSTNLQTGGEMIGVGLVAGSAAMGHNKRARTANRLASGLFIEVKDTDYPKWRIAFGSHDQIQQDRWYEIMQQALEGELT